jgi:hypothetical protein
VQEGVELINCSSNATASSVPEDERGAVAKGGVDPSAVDHRLPHPHLRNSALHDLVPRFGANSALQVPLN